MNTQTNTRRKGWRKRQMSEAEKQAYEERKAKRRALAKLVAGMSQDQRLAMAAKSGLRMITGHELSTFNTCFVLTQDPEATVLGGRDQWWKAGRKLKKGCHSVAIWRPIGGETNKETGETVVDPDDRRFALISIYDITATEPVDGIDSETIEAIEMANPSVQDSTQPIQGRVNIMQLAESEAI